MRFSQVMVAAAAIALWTGAAAAATVDLATGRSWTTGSNSYTGTDGVSVSLDGVIHSGGDINRAGSRNVYTASWSGSSGGVGVCSDLGRRWCNESHLVDGGGVLEGILVRFNQSVRILGLEFRYIDADDQVSLYTYAESPSATTYDRPLSTSFTSYIGRDQFESDPHDFSNLVGQSFLIGASDRNDDWKLRAIHYEVAPVPLPAAGLMLLAGLGGLGLMRRRQRNAA